MQCKSVSRLVRLTKNVNIIHYIYHASVINFIIFYANRIRFEVDSYWSRYHGGDDSNANKEEVGDEEGAEFKRG